MSSDVMQAVIAQLQSDTKDRAEQGAFRMINQQLMMLLVSKTDLLADLTADRRQHLESAISVALSLTDLMHNSTSLESYAALVQHRIETLNDER